MPKLIPFKVLESEVGIRGNDYSFDRYKRNEMIDKGYSGKDIIVGTIDTGVEWSHPSFCRSLEEGRLKYFGLRGDDGTDYNGHGTWVASKIITDNCGFSPECNLISAKGLSNDGGGSLSDIEYCAKKLIYDYGIQVLSTSIGWPFRNKTDDFLVKICEDNNVAWFSASGNDSKMNDVDFPAANDYPFAVGSIDEDGSISSFSDFGKESDLYAPGSQLAGAYIGGVYRKLQGTSMATPISASQYINVLKHLEEKYPNLSIHERIKLVVSCQ